MVTTKGQKDLTGLRVGRLVVLEPAGVVITKGGSKVSTWLCQCDCGKTTVVRRIALTTTNTRSCGCLKKELMSELGKSKRLPSGVSQRNIVLNSYKQGAARRGLEWGLSDEEFDGIIKKVCSYCGALPSPPRRKTQRMLFGEFEFNGIDRVDNLKGYTPENVVPCCTVCNRMKLELSAIEFIEHIQRVLAYYRTGVTDV